MENPLDLAEKIFGSQSAIAAKLSIKPQAVQQWKFIPESRALEFEKLTAGKIKAREVLEYAARFRKARAAA